MAQRVAVVTGGGKGIGRAILRRLAAGGHRVVAVGREEAALGDACRELGPEASYRLCDVTQETAVEALFRELEPVDILVNNAGVAHSAALQATSLEDWERHLRVNATGAFLCTRAVLPGMRQRGWGRIVTVASVASLVGAAYTAAYSASKHAVLGLMRVAATEAAGSGVTANAVCPTYVRTEMTQRSVQRIAEQTGRSPEEALRALLRQVPLGRLLEPEEVAAAVAYLVSEEAGAVSGQALVLDGGGVQH